MTRSRKEFTAKTKLAAWSRSQGKCESCTNKIVGKLGPTQYDHIIPDFMDGGNDLYNCRVLCRPCHQLKTTGEDVPKIAKARRIRRKAAGVASRKRLIPGSKGSGFRKKMDGSIIKED